MISRIVTGTGLTPFTPAERKALRSLRASYQSVQHLFTDRELAHLLFLRWRVESSRWDGATGEVDSRETTCIGVDKTRSCAKEMPACAPRFIG